MSKQTVILKMIADAEILNKHVRTIALAVAGVRRILYRNEPHNIASAYVNFYVDGDTVTAWFSEVVMGSGNDENMDFPVQYLWDDDYLNTEIVACAERNRLADLKTRLDKIQANAAVEAKERAEYARLHVKYGEPRN